MTSSDSAVEFTCNVCGHGNRTPREQFGRETPSCSGCGSTVRTRAIVLMLSRELFGTDLALPDFPVLKGIRGLGISDSADYAQRLGEKFEYRNTHYHKEPQFDIVHPPETEWGRYDFLIASEVLEHVAPPADRGFRNAFRLLKPHGVFLFTVPYTLERSTSEHFPDLHDYALAQLRDRTVLVNRTRAGDLQVFEDLVFHGGHGSTLEMRRFSESALRDQFCDAGFSTVQIYSENHDPFGIVHSETWSLPMVARKEAFRFDLGCASDLLGQWSAARTRLTSEIRRLNEHSAKQKAEYDEWVIWAKGRIAELEREVEERTRWAQDMERQFVERTQWAFSLEKESSEHLALAKKFQADANEKTVWAIQLQNEVENVREQLQRLKSAPWTKAGRRFGALKE